MKAEAPMAAGTWVSGIHAGSRFGANHHQSQCRPKLMHAGAPIAASI